ncbi:MULTISPECIES: ATP-dependent DNA helicase [Sporosarcina]|uniref:ATP-dependent DNA helicase n=1 Tax=Sporosarcina TaxID=1569 RepID=UPI00078BEEBF|nr:MULTISPECIES: ATP-dependent DNA helicase [Sporosarcina]AMQ06837.1 ATP-dependent helicase [Sporosarcina psychrophila]QNK86527.1 ATP-dependent DNA helicase [Sporosarcina sp. resist]
MKSKMPFPLSKDKSFYESLNDWIGDTLYDELTEKGFECRDEQIYMAFQIEQALKEKKVLFAEAGVGTGKTIAYLLPAIAYARYTGKPALISCADETLIDQLVKEDGDIRKISEALGLDIDVRLAKSRDQYLCLKRLEEAGNTIDEDYVDVVADELPEFVYGSGSLQSIFPYGERSDYPNLSDEEWKTVNFHPIQQCAACDVRNRCGQTIHRNHYRESVELVICSHDFYMEHIWTKESRKRQGQLPLLPEPSMIVFDEGHLLEYSAQRALTYEVQNSTLLNLLERIMVDGIRESTLQLMERLIDSHEAFFKLLDALADTTENERKAIEKTPELLAIGKEVVKISNALLEEFVFEGELYIIPAYDLRMVEEYLDQYIYSMDLFTSQNDAVDWLEGREGESTLVIMPRLVTDILREKLFSSNTPIVFSSATLSVGETFTYLADGLGIQDYLSFSVESPFDYDEVMEVFATDVEAGGKAKRALELLEDGEQTLILFKSERAMNHFKERVPSEWQDRIAFEGERELSSIVRDFQQKKVPVLCSYHLWEGLDIPQDALTRVIIYDLPLPPSDPLFDARRQHAKDPFREVDLPFMLLRLRQGAGRLIRTSADSGTVHLLLEGKEQEMKAEIESIFPVKMKMTV